MGFDFKISDDEIAALIMKYCRDLTQRAKEGRLEPVIGREQEVEKICTILLQRGRGNVAVLGESGVGKSAMFLAVAHAFAADQVPGRLKGGRVIELDLGLMEAGASSKEDLESRLLPLIQGVAERNEAGGASPIIICLDEIHTHLSAGSLGVAEVLKPYLAEGHLRMIGATTSDEYQKYLRPDEALDRRFQKIVVDEPDAQETLVILQGLRDRFESYHGLKISDEVLEAVIRLTGKYISKARKQPDKALVVLDAACARAIMEGEETVLSVDHVRMAIGAEVNLNPSALD